MHVVVNSIPAKGIVTGIGRYVRSLYDAVLRRGDTEVTFFDGKTIEKVLPPYPDPAKYVAVADRLSNFPWWLLTFHRAIFWLGFEIRLNSVLKRQHASLYHEPGFFPARVTHCPQVLTIYDLSLIKMPYFHPKDRVAFFRLFFKRRLPFASHIITISEFIRQEVLEFLPVEPHRVTAVPLASSGNFRPRAISSVRNIMEKYGLRKPYILAVGTIDPRKNLRLLLRSLALMNREDVMLVMVGWKGWGYGDLANEIEKLKARIPIRFLGYLSDEELAALYSGAHFLVYPSLYEGFGLPVLEAMACGCPVICSSTSSLPEVAGDAALYIDPHNAGDLAGKMELLLDDEPMRQDLVHRGLLRAAEFSWEKVAEKTLQVFRSII
ncbi:MAG: glycosyltransferase family 4 protein [Thermodesulforhabdaceae bacterium]